MENYVKAEEEEFVPECSIEGTSEGTVVMRVKPGSKTKNLVQFAEKKLSAESVSQIIWEGSGDAIQKTISCAEIMKKKFNHSLHQITRLASVTIVETWNPRLDGLDAIRVKRLLPLVKILLSKDPLDADACGYQGPEDVHGLFHRGTTQPSSNKSQRNKRLLKTNTTKGVNTDQERDETLLGDTRRRTLFEKQMKMEKKNRKSAAGKTPQLQKESSNLEATPAPALMPEASSQLPKASSQLPKASSQLPESSSQLPEASSQLPEASSQLPEASPQKPEASVQQTEATPVVLEAGQSSAAGCGHSEKAGECVEAMVVDA